jgi:RNA-directed DNA polymerase
MYKTQLEKEKDVVIQGKAFEIPKQLIWESYKQVKTNRGAPGVDGQSIARFDENRDNNLYKIWNRLSSGSYLPPPVLEKCIPKGNGGKRILGIPTVGDRVAQGAIKLYMEAQLDPIFHQDSYGYRPNKSAHQALEQCKRRCWSYSWVVEIDIKGFFDNVRHDLVIKALEYHDMPKWVILYCKRWLRAPVQSSNEEGVMKEREIGTPQGGVISPLLANLFLHYAFDKWMMKEALMHPFERYADDLVCHCQTMKEAIRLKEKITERFRQVGLSVNEEKSKIVYVDTFKRWNVQTSFTFLGYDFKLRTLKDKQGFLFRKCMPGASKKAMVRITEEIKKWGVHRSTEDAQELARRYNAKLKGWIEYYGKFWYRKFSYHLWTVFQSRLIKWAKTKYRISIKAAQHRLSRLRKERPKLFAHWYLLRATNV